MATKFFVLISVVLAFVFGFAPPAAAQIQDCICNEIGGGPPGFPPHPNMKPDTTYACVDRDLVATLVFNRQVAVTVATRGSFPGFSSPNPAAACGAHQGLRLAGTAPIGAAALDANTVQLTYDGTDTTIQGLITMAPVSLTVSGTYFAQPHLVDQGELLCIQKIDGLGLLENLDADRDGVLDCDDFCPDTVISEGVPTVNLGTNRWALVDDDFDFDTKAPKGKGPGRSYSTADTAGCSCEQIIAEQGLGKGHTKFGCSISAMDDWLARVN